ncbi:unnamed protein product, partial [Mesorhabditis spiculigera]
MAEGEAKKRAGEPGIDATDESTRKKPKQTRATFVAPLQEVGIGASARKKKPNLLRPSFVVPQEGIRNGEGALFHHTGPRRLCQEGLQRLEEAGITIKTTQFDKQEDEILQRNWYEFADQYGLDDKDALSLSGVNAKSRGAGMDERSIFIQKTQFFPKMCRNLEHRTGETVITAMRRLFDPNALESTRDVAMRFTEEEDQMLREYYEKGWTLFKISEVLKKAQGRIQSRIKYFRRLGLTRTRGVSIMDVNPKTDFFWATSYTRDQRKSYKLPETGILDENGDLFYHGNPKFKLTTRCLERLQEHGVVIQATHFKDAEKRKALRNATKLMKEYRMSRLLFICMLNYTKYAKALYNRNEAILEAEDHRFFDWTFQQRQLFTAANRFWPRLCEGLPTRVTPAVCAVVCELIDPANDFPGAMDALTQEQYYELDRLYRIHRSGSLAAVWLKKPLRRTMAALQHHQLRSMTLRRSERRRLWNILGRQYAGGGPKLVRRELRKGKSKIDFKVVARLLCRHIHIVRDAWREIIDDFKEALLDKPFDEAVEEVIPKPYPITGREFHDFIELFIDYNPNVIMRYMKFKDADRLRMERGMIRLGLTGFYTGPRTEFQYCIVLLRRVIYQVCEKLKPVVDLTTVSRKDALKVLSKCFAAHGDKPFRNLACKDFVDMLLRHMAENHPDWQPPEGLLNWAEKLAELQEKDGHSNLISWMLKKKQSAKGSTKGFVTVRAISSIIPAGVHFAKKDCSGFKKLASQIKTKRFQKTEDEIIQRNWYEFADQYGLDDKDILYLCGVNAKPGPTVMDERGAFILKTHFLPRMCRHLEQRTATAVIEAILRLYDPVAKDPNIDYSLKFTKEEDDMLQEYYRKGWTFFKIAEAMKKPKMRIRARIAYFRKLGLTRTKNTRSHEDAMSDYYWMTSYTRDVRFQIGYPMPETGVLDANGDFFYHANPKYRLTLPVLERLQSHNVVIEANRLTTEERRKVLRNATKLMKEFKMGPLLFMCVMGFNKYAKALYKQHSDALEAPDDRFFEWTFRQRAQFTSTNRFWPRLCEGLPTRGTPTVCRAVRELLDPATNFPGAMDPLTEEDYYELDRLYRIHRSYSLVAVWMRKPLRRITQAREIHRHRSVPLRRTERRRLWNILAKHYAGGGPKLVRKELRKGRSKFDLKIMARLLGRHSQIVRDAWREIIDDFREQLEEKTFDEAVKEIIPKPYRITGREFHDFLELFIDYNPNVIMRMMQFRDADRLKMEQGMVRLGLTGFYTGSRTEFKYCIWLLGKVIYRVCAQLKPVVDLTTVAKYDALKVLSKCFASQGDKALPHMAENHPDWQPPEGLLDWAERLAELQEKDDPRM